MVGIESEKKKAYLNIFCTIVAQVFSILNGLIVPRILLSTFGSEANGLVSSLVQFMNYIALVEGGLGSVVLAALYSPLAKKDNEQLNTVLCVANKFFRKLAWIFVVYVVVLGGAYPYIVKTTFSNLYVFILILILAFSLFIQYFFSITYKLLLQADQKMYIVQILQIITTCINLLMVIFLVKYFPNLIVVKFGSALIYVIQPIIYSNYVKKHYNIRYSKKVDNTVLSQRWNCFGQNLAFFIHNNTDTVVLSLFCNLKVVSVYTVYYLVVNNLKNFFMSFSNAFSPMLGKALAKNDLERANKVLNMYEFIVFNAATFVFGCCVCLLPNFVMLYTKGIEDVNYYQPIFSSILVLAEFIYCIRNPYVEVVYAVGQFKETEKSAYIEAAINIILSVILVKKYGLSGIAVGTFVGMMYRMFYHVWYLSCHILNRPIWLFSKRLLNSILVIFISNWIVKEWFLLNEASIISFVKNIIFCVITFSSILIIANYIFDRDIFLKFLKSFFKNKIL